MKKINTYTLIYFQNKKPLKKRYDTSVKAFNEYQDKGCIFVELFNENNIRISSYPNKI